MEDSLKSKLRFDIPLNFLPVSIFMSRSMLSEADKNLQELQDESGSGSIDNADNGTKLQHRPKIKSKIKSNTDDDSVKSKREKVAWSFCHL